MSKENILHGIIGILLGLIIGFLGANSLNQRATTGSGALAQNSNMPAGHPDVTGLEGQGPSGPVMQQVQETVAKAKGNPNDFDAQLGAGSAYLQIGRFSEAVAFLKQANTLKPDDLEAVTQLAFALLRSGSLDEAAEVCKKTLAKKDSTDLRNLLGMTFIARQPPDLDKGIAEYQKALKLKPDNVNALVNLTDAYVMKKDVTKARETLALLEKTDPQNETIVELKQEIDKLGAN